VKNLCHNFYFVPFFALVAASQVEPVFPIPVSLSMLEV